MFPSCYSLPPNHALLRQRLWVPGSRPKARPGMTAKHCHSGAAKRSPALCCPPVVPSPLRGGLGWGCRRSSTSVTPTPPPPTPPRKGEERSDADRGACCASSCADPVPSPSREGGGAGASSMSVTPTPPPPTPPRKGEESSDADRGACCASSCADPVSSPARGRRRRERGPR